MDTIMPVDTEKLCRLCMKDSLCHSYMYDKAFGREYLLSDVINELYQLNVDQMDGLPSYLCLLCHAKIIEFKTFKDEAQNVLQQLIDLKGVAGNSEVKEERDINEEDGLNDGEISEESVIEEFEVNFPTVKTEPIDDCILRENEYQACLDQNQSLNTSDPTLENFPTDETSSDTKFRNVSQQEVLEHVPVEIGAPRDKAGYVEATAAPERRRQKKNTFLLECTECYETFHREYDYWLHIKEHEGQTGYNCSICKVSFVDKRDLNSHLKSHRNRRPYVCLKCGKTFMKSCHLKGHDRVHTGEKPYKCQFCDKSFSQQSNMVTHLSTHTNARPFRCDICDKRFNQKSSLCKHRRIHMRNDK